MLVLIPLIALSTACAEPVKLNPPPPPPERMVCAELPAPPAIEGLVAFPLGESTVYDSGQVDRRDAKIARWIVAVRDSWFSCSNNLAWIRQYFQEQE